MTKSPKTGKIALSAIEKAVLARRLYRRLQPHGTTQPTTKKRK